MRGIGNACRFCWIELIEERVGVEPRRLCHVFQISDRIEVSENQLAIRLLCVEIGENHPDPRMIA